MRTRRYLRRVALLVSFLLMAPLAATGARAQPAQPVQSAPAAPTTEQLQQLVATLKDEQARTQLIDQLQALIAAQNAVAKPQSSSPFAWLAALPAELDAVGGEVLDAIPIFVQAPHSIAWFKEQVTDPRLQQRWLDIFEKLVAVFGAGIVADAIASLLLRRLSTRLKTRAAEPSPARWLLLALLALFEILPVLIFASVATFVLPLTEPRVGTRGVVEVLIAATLWARGLLAIARVILFTPRPQPQSGLTDETRNYLYIWIRRFAQWGAYGYAISSGAWWLSAPSPVVGLLLRVSVLVLAILAVIFVLQNRAAVSQWLRGNDRGKRTGWRILRNRLAETWHILAIVYIVGSFGIYMLNAEGGLALLLRATASSLVVVTAAALLVRAVDQLLRRGFAVNPDLKNRFPMLEARANRYVPVLSWIATAAIYVLATLAVLQAWGISAFAWFQATAGSRLATTTFGIAVALAVAVVAWESFVFALERYLQNLESDSRRHARARTLFPMLRLLVLIALLVLLCFIVLGQLGINLGALIAGAGIFGLIAGLGSQSFLKDTITSFAVLIDDTFAIGDVIDVGSGRSGVVEAMSITTVKLRAFDGSLYSVPFGEMKVIQNLTKDYAFYVANVAVAYHEDTDRVAAILAQIVDGMRQDAKLGALILAPLEVVGVDKFAASSVILVVRIKTLPIHQWTVGREFNRRLKQVFAEKGIEMGDVQRLRVDVAQAGADAIVGG